MILINHSSFRKQCILAENRFDFLKDLVVSIPDYQGEGEEGIVATVPSTTPMLHPPILRSNSTSESLTGSPSVSKRTGGTPRPRGRPRKNASLPPSNSNVQRFVTIIYLVFFHSIVNFYHFTIFISYYSIQFHSFG